MDITGILQRVFTLYEERRGPEAEILLQEAAREAVAEQDDASLLQLLNELLGYYRETSQVEKSFEMAERAVRLAQNMGLQGTIPYATTLLNVATVYRAAGNLEDSLALYLEVEGIYFRLLGAEDMLVASLENNKSLLYQEMGDFVMARECQLKALAIASANDAGFERAVTCANLAGTCLQLGQSEEAYKYAEQAIRDFDAMGVADAHYGAALSAMGIYHYQRGEYEAAGKAFRNAMEIIEENLGRNGHYYRLKENLEACQAALAQAAEQEPAEQRQKEQQKQKPSYTPEKKGLDLCREYYETYGKPMIHEKFPAYEDRIAVGLAGEGSDCFGFDDAVSRDHDWGPDFCMWVTEETYGQIGEELQRAYEELPKEFQGYQRTYSARGAGRRGVMTIDGFYRRILQTEDYQEISYAQVSDAALAAAVNGEVFRDEEGIFTAIRERLKQGYPESDRFLRLADSAARFSQCGQYNYGRMKERGDELTASIMLSDCIREAMKLQHYIAGVYPPHDKWIAKSLRTLKNGERLWELLEDVRMCSSQVCSSQMSTSRMYSSQTEASEPGSAQSKAAKAASMAAEQLLLEKIEQVGDFLAREMYGANFISDIDPYLDAHTEELAQKAMLSAQSNEELVERIAELEFEAFDKVKNVGGRADCQNDWATFSIMRKSQYLTWSRTMLLQYLYDFYREYRKGHNLITEKYGRMMESTAPEEYEQIRHNFPVLTPEKKAIIEQIVSLQVAWMEEFANQYPTLAENARSIHTMEDSLYNTSYETYLRGEVSTYSDKMLELYGRYLVSYAEEGRNLTFAIMENSVHLYGYESLDAAEKFLRE